MNAPQNSDSSPRPKYQFRLRYLFYLCTLTAVGFAILRYVFDVSVDIVFRSVITAYVALLIAYLAFRFPILVRRLRASHKKLQSKRTELEDFADQIRKEKGEE